MARRLPALVRALLDPAVYPHPVDRVVLIETHISCPAPDVYPGVIQLKGSRHRVRFGGRGRTVGP
ncbi:MAG: hypothetical protein HYV92_01390 [Candidatus Rokubacteria bacterium]|nr:hypothetical protein [Candidatus Rokubacteria bacterium]MBI3029673.1 hypothetical protein [Candidatus Rokubacteria bacterium]